MCGRVLPGLLREVEGMMVGLLQTHGVALSRKLTDGEKCDPLGKRELGFRRG